MHGLCPDHERAIDASDTADTTVILLMRVLSIVWHSEGVGSGVN